MAKNKLHTEKIPLFVLYRQDGKIQHQKMNGASEWEIYGYIKILLENVETNLYMDLNNNKR